MICERCKADTYMLEKCGYCGRTVCGACVKSSKRKHKTTRFVICRDCWGDMKKRAQFKKL